LKIKVLKFGGTSVATKEARAAAAQRVFDAREQGFSPIAVVSAIGRKGAPYATDTLINEFKEVNPQLPAIARELDLIMACGEIISAAIFSQSCRSLGFKAAAVTGMQAGISTDGKFGNARIVSVDPKKILALLERDVTPVICGFQGSPVDEPDEITTLGRGGTDTTAAAIGAAVKACAVEIYTDVDGIKTADPDSVPNAPTLRRMSYDEVAELAHLGAKVLHPRAAEIAMRYSIPLWVKNSFSGDEGTEIVSEDVSYSRNVTGITHSGKLVYLQFDLAKLSQMDRAKLERQLFAMCARFGIALHMLNLSPEGVGFAINREQYANAERLLDGLVIPIASGKDFILQLGTASQKVQAQQEMLRHVQPVVAEKTEGCTMISVIGRTYFGKPGVFYRILRILHEAKVQVFQTADSDFSVSFLIPETETYRAVRVVHDNLVPESVS
jgi:aspartate kinase